MEVKKSISCNLIFEDGSKMEIEPPVSGIILEREDYCGSCGRYIPLHFWIYCPYCGEKKIRNTEFTFTIPEETIRKIEGVKDKNE